jgi:DnaK suppressor protein
MPSDMAEHENIAKTLKARLSEPTGRLAEIDSELHKPLSADLEEQATDLENLDALKAIENYEIHEIHQIQKALKRISEGTYGICSQCGEDIDPKRLEALPTATRCIACAA